MTTSNGAVDRTRVSSDESVAHRAVGGAFAGFFVDMFDVYLPIVALAPAAEYFQAKGVSASTASLLSAMVFVAALIGRPIGAAIFGHFSDKVGRRRIALISVGGFGVVTLIIALLPGYEQIGVGAVIALILLRLVDGILLGGEYTAAAPLAMEYSPQKKRGLYGGLIMTGFPLAYSVISLITLLMLAIHRRTDCTVPMCSGVGGSRSPSERCWRLRSWPTTPRPCPSPRYGKTHPAPSRPCANCSRATAGGASAKSS